MIGIEGILSLAAYATAIIASLQAASRAKFLLEHNQIGVKDGPLIMAPVGNETSPLWDLVQVFQESVRLGLDYHFDGEEKGFVVHSSSQHMESGNKEHDLKIEPYSLSPFPTTTTSEDVLLDRLVDMYIEEADDASDKKRTDNFLKQKLKHMAGKYWPTSSLSKLKKTTNYWMARAYYWRKSIEEFEEEFLGDTDDDLDLSLCISKKIRLVDGDVTQQVAQITSYAPEGFAKLRSYFRISEEAFRRSIFESGPYISFQSNSKGAARVGGVFFFTRDGAYMIKTIKTQEAQTLIRILPKYYKHMKRYRRKSLLTRFCGLYTVSIRDATSRTGMINEKRYTFVIMNSVFPAEGSQFISEMYDLKGSTEGRECSPEERKKKGSGAVLKDLDLAREVALTRQLDNENKGSASSGYGIEVGASAKSELLAQLRKDVDLLRDCHVMDYSLLVGIVNMDPSVVDAADVNAMELSINQEKLFGFRRRNVKPFDKLVTSLLTPVRLMAAPPLFFGRRCWSLVERIMTSVLTYPLPYYGSSVCGVDGGAFSVMHGKRSGKRAIYYLGLIDFLQPWTVQKVAEKQLKGLIGYDTSAISCVDPVEYSTRFLEFIDAHVS